MNVLITGVSSGIGWGLAHHYLNQGDQVFGLSRRIPEDFINHPNFRHFQFNITHHEKAPMVLKYLLAEVQTLDLVVLNAGMLGPIGDMKNQSIQDLKQLMEVNVWSNKPIIDSILLDIPNTPKIVAISSGAAVNGNKGWGGYSISKAALNMFVKLYASENKHTKFYALAPGLVDTAMQDYLCGEEFSEEDFPAASKFKAARGTDAMPKPNDAAKLLDDAIKRLDEYPTGAFVDVRKM